MVLSSFKRFTAMHKACLFQWMSNIRKNGRFAHITWFVYILLLVIQTISIINPIRFLLSITQPMGFLNPLFQYIPMHSRIDMLISSISFRDTWWLAIGKFLDFTLFWSVCFHCTFFLWFFRLIIKFVVIDLNYINYLLHLNGWCVQFSLIFSL